MSKVLQRRAFDADIKVRSNPDGTIGVRGYAIVFGQTAYGERIHPAAVNRTLAQKDDVRLLVNHEGVPVARTKAGTLTLGVDEHGEWFDAPSLDPSNPDVQRLMSAISRGDIDQCSFAGYFLDVVTVDGVQEVREIQQTDVSIVTYPWYDQTTVGITGDRDVDRALVCLRSLTPDQRAKVEAAAGSTVDGDQLAAIRALRAAPPGGKSYSDITYLVLDAIEASIEATGGSAPYMWLDDLGPDWAVYAVYGDGDYHYFQVGYSLTGDVVALAGAPFEVDRITEYRPVVEADPATDPTGDRGAPVPALTVAQARALLLDGLDPAA